jgi:hypothetical protein
MKNFAPPADGERVDVSFSLARSGTRTVCVAIFFNDWPPQLRRALRLPWSGSERREPPSVRALVRLSEVKPALWRGEVSLRPGWCEYLFLVDAQWMLDPAAPEKCPDGDGDFSSTRWIESVARPGMLR